MTPDLWQDVLDLSLEHLQLALIAMLFAAAIGLPLGIAATRSRTLERVALGFVNIVQTVPSLALFGFLIPIPFLGIGRTTAILALILYALLLPASGEVRVNGRATTSWQPVELRRSIGYVMQESGLLPHLTVRQNIELPQRLKGEAPQGVEELLERVGLPANEYGQRKPRELSGGQRQRVAVARALAAKPSLMLLDEPFGALDPVTRLDMQRLFRKLREDIKITAIFVTHDIREAMLLGHRIGLLHQGSLEYFGSAEGFANADSQEARAFLQVLETP